MSPSSAPASLFSLAALIAVGVAGCAPEASTPETTSTISALQVQQVTKASAFELNWSASVPEVPVHIEVSTDPTAAPGEGVIIAENLTATNFSWNADGERARRYFTVIPENGEPDTAAPRLLPLEGGRNFRDMGGYETEDGHTVKWGQVFRSGTMYELTDGDYDYLSDIGVKVVCDFRTSEERATEPTQWRAGEAEYVYFPDPASDPGGNFMRVLFEPDVTPEMVADAMAQGYPMIAKEQAPAYTAMFDRLAAGEIPLAFNCSAGKDRAGTAAALLLTALGVPRETVVADYALSETYVDYMAEFAGSEDSPIPEDSPYAYLASMPPELLAPLMRSDPRYIETTFSALEEEYGSVMNFIQTELEVSDQELQAIRSALLE